MDSSDSKERRLVEEIKASLALGRQVQVYAVYTQKRDVTRRLESILAKEGIRVAVLTTQVAPEEREAWYERQLRSGLQPPGTYLCNGTCNGTQVQFILTVLEENMPRKTHESEYTAEHARGGVHTELPDIETWENQYPNYEITITVPEFTCICPRTGLPDFGTITIHYEPHKLCLELKSLKAYIVAFRNVGIFNENATNRILDDVARAAKPKWAVVKGEFSARGGMRTFVEVRYPRKKRA